MKDRAKEDSSESNRKGGTVRKRLFAYSFFLMDLNTRMYVAFGSSMKSERDAYIKAMEMPRSTGVTLNSLRLDRYYSSPFYVDVIKEGVPDTKEELNAQRFS